MWMYKQVHESPEDYKAVTLPFIEAIPAARTQWVQNILDGKASTVSLLTHRLTQAGRGSQSSLSKNPNHLNLLPGDYSCESYAAGRQRLTESSAVTQTPT